MEKPKLKFEEPHVKGQSDRRFKPSEEFLDAEISFEYSFTLPGGEKLEVSQSNRGGGSVVIKRGNEVIFDIRSLLPEGYKMVTPTYFKKHPKESALFDYLDNSWAQSPERKMIMLENSKGLKIY